MTSVKRLVTALTFVWSVLGVSLYAQSSAQERFNAIRSYVARVDASKFETLLAEDVRLVHEAIEVSHAEPMHKLVLEQIRSKFARLPEFSDRKIVITIFRPKTAFKPAIAVGDNVFVSETLLDRLLAKPDGRGIIEAIIAHELSHSKRDFLVIRAIVNDQILSTVDKEHFLFEIELDADRGAIDMLQRSGGDAQQVSTMLEGFKETERLKEANNYVGTKQQ